MGWLDPRTSPRDRDCERRVRAVAVAVDVEATRKQVTASAIRRRPQEVVAIRPGHGVKLVAGLPPADTRLAPYHRPDRRRERTMAPSMEWMTSMVSADPSPKKFPHQMEEFRHVR